jgi:hemoglobin
MFRQANLLLGFLLLLLCPAWSAAQSLAPRDLDARIERQLFEVLKLGTDIYNRGAQDACYRLYQGSLMSMIGFLEHRPDQIKKIQRALNDTNDMTNVSERAHALRIAIDNLREAIKPSLVGQSTQGVTQPGRPTLWDRLGGELTVTLVVEDLVTRVLKNPRINFVRRGTGEQWEANPENLSKLKRQFILWISSVSGGPLKYEKKDMKTVHLKMKISETEYDSFMFELKASLDKYFISPAEIIELVKQFEAVKKDIVDTSIPTKSLWDRLGGEAVATLLVEDFVNRVSKNAAVNFTRKDEGKTWSGTPEEVATLKKQLVQWLSSVTGGPLKYTGKSLKVAHAGMKITNVQYTAMMVDLKASLDQLKINEPEHAELINLLNGFRKEIVEAK